MKTIPVTLLESFKRRGRSTCFAVKIVDKDGLAYGFTTLDARIRFSDGYHDLWYLPSQELRPQSIENYSDLDVDSTDLLGWFNDEMEELIVTGRFGSGELTIYRLSYLELNRGAEVVAFGTVGEVEFAANRQGKRRVEFRALEYQLKRKVNPQYSLTCRNDFGDDNCGLPFVWEAATISDVADNFLRFRVTGVARPDGYFDFGVVEFLSGDNSGDTVEIESWTTDGWLTLSFVTRYAIPVGGSVRLRQDCDKLAATCIARGNIINMAAEHLTPVEEQSIMVPGAYIKSNNAA